MLNRRSAFLTAGAALATAGMSARSYAQIIGANERVRFAVMGVNGRGVPHMNAIAALPNTAVSHLIDVDRNILDQRASEFTARGGSGFALAHDYRRVIESADTDVLTIAAPDHWHARAAIDALAAGKHVYIEKPCSVTPHEGEALVAAQQRYGRVVQMGNQQRSSVETKDLMHLIQEGLLGEIYEVDTWYANSRGSIGVGVDGPPPPHLDWELWQGPAPRRAYRSNVVHYNWHWFWRWGTGEICNNALHELDLARWALGVTYPEHVSALGQRRFYQNDDWEMYDTMRLELTFPGGKIARWTGHSCNNLQRFGRGRGALIMGTNGSALLDRNGYTIFDLRGAKVREVTATAASATVDTRGEGVLDLLHLENMIAVMRGQTDQQASPIAEGHISTMLCHLGNIAYRTDGALSCDPVTGRPSSREALRYWRRDYADGWEIPTTQ
ncbi:MAG: Gfo/Idh/MocA family oxidoreductase [Terricaulis sp.]